MFAAIDNIPYIYGSTNTADALKTMRNRMFTLRNGDRPDVPNLVILITDGVSNINAQRTIPEAKRARDAEIHIYAIGIGLSDTRELDAIASVPASENSYAVQDFDELRGLDKRIFSAICPGSLALHKDTSLSTCIQELKLNDHSCIYKYAILSCILFVSNTLNEQSISRRVWFI